MPIPTSLTLALLLVFSPGVSSEAAPKVEKQVGVLGVQMDYSVDAASGGQMQIFRVNPGSAAEAAGLRPGDLVVAVDGHPLRYKDSLAFYQADLFEAGKKVQLTVNRGKERLELDLVPAGGGSAAQVIERHMAALERCGGDVACATGCAEQPIVTRQDSAFAKLLATLPGQEANLVLVRGTPQATLLIEGKPERYAGDPLLEQLVQGVLPLLDRVERVELKAGLDSSGHIGVEVLNQALAGSPKP